MGMEVQRTRDSESKQEKESKQVFVCQPGSCQKKPMEFGALQFGHEKANSGHAKIGDGNYSQALGSHQDNHRTEPEFVPAENLPCIQTPISESETTIQDHWIVNIPSGANFQAGTFGESNDTGTQNPTDGQNWLKISKILIAVSAGAVYNSSSMFAKAANTLAFMATLTAISLRPTRSRAIRISTKFGAIACAAGTLAAIGHDLPDDYWWASGVAFLIPAVAVAVA